MDTRNERRMHELHAYHDGELGWLARWRVERRLARDPEARAELAGLADLGDLLREGEAAATTPDLWPELRAQLPARRAEPVDEPTLEGLGGGRAWFPAWAPAGLAAAAVAAVIAFGIGGGEAPAVHSVRWLDTGGQSAMVLQDDGEATIIWILDGSGEQTRGQEPRRGERAFI